MTGVVADAEARLQMTNRERMRRVRSLAGTGAIPSVSTAGASGPRCSTGSGFIGESLVES
jgi:hypothetical protein